MKDTAVWGIDEAACARFYPEGYISRKCLLKLLLGMRICLLFERLANNIELIAN